jgi:uncharacterized phage protein (TIGR01671 family)
MQDFYFRGQRKDNKEWVYGSLFIDNTNKTYILTQTFSDNTINRYQVEGKTVGQYIGEIDKNGIQIFSGDIVLTNSDNRKCKVSFGHGGFFCVASVGGICTDFCDWHNFEIVGNIIDNPTLI